MIQTYSPTIRRKEMEGVLTCLVDEKIGPGETTIRLIQTVKECTHCDGAIALRSPAIALEYALLALQLPKGSSIMLSALAPSWQIITVERLGYKALVLDVEETTGQVSPQNVEHAIKDGGKLLILTESMGILPDIQAFLALGVPLIEDISHSALSYYPLFDDARQENAQNANVAGSKEEGDGSESVETYGKSAGMYGLYTIFGMEDHDTITAGGGALLLAPSRREWIVLKKVADAAPSTDIMPDMNAALALVELKEFPRNEETRRTLYELYSRATLSGKHKTYVRSSAQKGSTIYSFPLVLNSGFKDVKAYSQKKGIEVRQAYENSIIALRQEELSETCRCANSLFLRCALFPLYPRLGKKDTERIVKVLASLP